MSIKFSGNSIINYSTVGSNTVNWYGQTNASMSFLIRINTANPPGIPSGDLSLLAGKIFFDWWVDFIPTSGSSTVRLKFTIQDAAGTPHQLSVDLSIGVPHLVSLKTDGAAHVQTLTVDGFPTVISNFAGATWSGVSANSPMSLGIQVANPNIVFEIDQLFIVDGYTFTSADETAQLNNVNRSTLATGATWRGLYTLEGTGTPVVNAGGLVNSIDGTYNFVTKNGTGTAVYSAPLVWAPSTSVTPYVAMSGQMIGFYPFSLMLDGSQQTPTSVSSVPHLIVNGTDLGALGLGSSGWFPGGLPCLVFSTPSNYQIHPGDVCKLTAAPSWCTSTGGAVIGFDGTVAIDNRTGRSSVGTDTLEKTLVLGTNNSHQPFSSNQEFYSIFKNQKYKWGMPGQRGKVTANWAQSIFYGPITNGIDSTTYPGPVGKFLAMWDDTDSSNPCTGTWSTQQAGLTTVSGITSAHGALAGGQYIGSYTYADFQRLSPTGNAMTDTTFRLQGPGGTAPSYANLWIVFPGDWQLAGGVPILDRSDPYALSSVYLDRVPQNVGSLRWVDTGPVGPDPRWTPRPEQLQLLADENWGDTCGQKFTTSLSSFQAVNTTTFPWIYGEFFGKPGNLGATFPATLASTISTTPAVGTLETWTFSDGATAPLMAQLEVLVDSEIVRIISGSGTSWVVYRGSNGTTPATHSPGTVAVYGRIPITALLNSDGSQGGGDVIGFTSATPHGLTSFNIMQIVNNSPNITCDNGDVVPFQGNCVYVTGPTSGFRVQGGTAPHGIPTGTVSGGTCTFVNQYPDALVGASMPHEAQAIVTAKFPNADYHLNIHCDACDDYVWTLARRILPLWPVGRTIYVEHANEIWNQAFGIFGWIKDQVSRYLFASSDQTGYGVKRAVECAAIFRSVWGSRASEIKCVINCQVAGLDIAQHLTLANTNHWLIDRVMIAPYMDFESTAYNVGVVNSLNDAQVIDLFIHDLFYNTPRGLAGQVPFTQAAIDSYNASVQSWAPGFKCLLMGYEGGIESPIPLPAGFLGTGGGTNPTNWEERIHDIITHPNWYLAELDTYAFLQRNGFDKLHIYAMPGMYWGVQTWGGYRHLQQDHGRGDGSDGKLNNLLCRANPTSPQYKGSTVNQDLNTVSVRGEAFLDWHTALNPPSPPPTTATSSATCRLGW